MSNRRRFDIDITSIRQKENINEFPRYFDVFSWYNFDGQKMTLFRRTLFDVISMSKRSTSFRRALFEVILISQISASFRCSIDLISMDKKISVVSVYILMEFRWKTDVTWTDLFWCDFERQKILVVLIPLFPFWT